LFPAASVIIGPGCLNN